MAEQVIVVSLTEREKDVLKLAIEGMTNKEIAKILWIGRRTVETHLKNIRSKLRAKSTLEAAVIAIRNSLI